MTLGESSVTPEQFARLHWIYVSCEGPVLLAEGVWGAEWPVHLPSSPCTYSSSTWSAIDRDYKSSPSY